MRKLILLYFLFFITCGFSQTKLVFIDSISNEPSPYIMLFNEDNKIIGTSNELGEITIEDSLSLTNKIFLRNIFYESKELLINNFGSNETILLNPIVNLLDEVKIDLNKYIVLTAYYRIYNLVDDILTSFVDAEVKYIIKKNSIQKKILNCRIFDTIPVSEYNLKAKNPYWISDLKKTSLFEKLNSKFNLIKDKECDIINIIGKEDKLLYATIKVNSKNASNIKIETLRRSKYFDGIKEEEYNNEELLKVTIKDLKYRSKEKQLIVTDDYIKFNPLLKGKEIMFNKREIFVQSVEYVSKDEYKKIKKMGYKDTSISHYKKEFWKGLDNYKPLDSLIEEQIKTNLVERK